MGVSSDALATSTCHDPPGRSRSCSRQAVSLSRLDSDTYCRTLGDTDSNLDSDCNTLSQSNANRNAKPDAKGNRDADSNAD